MVSVAPTTEPTTGIIMTNEKGDTNPEDAVSCFALSKNDSYLMSASGGKITLFNMMTSKVKFRVISPLLDSTTGYVIESVTCIQQFLFTLIVVYDLWPTLHM